MLRIAIIAIGGLLALAGPASAAPHGFVVDGPFTVNDSKLPPRVNQFALELEGKITGYAVPGTQVGSEG